MKKTTGFAIKANIASWLLFALVSFFLAVLLGDMLRSLMENTYFSGLFSLVLQFFALFFSVKTLLKNSNFSADERNIAFQMTWYMFIAFTIVSFILMFSDLVAQFGLVYQLVYVSLTLLVGYAALFFLKKERLEKK